MVIKKIKDKNNFFYFAHRGAQKIYHENSLKAFEKAIKLGCDGIEIDIQITKDRKIIIFHDLYITLHNKKYFISKSTHKEIIDLCSSTKQPKPQLFHNIIPLINSNPDIIFNIEIKSTTYRNHVIIRSLNNFISNFTKYNQCIFSSFNLWVLMQLKFYLGKKVFIGMILGRRQMQKIPNSIFNKLIIKFIKPHFLHPNADYLNLEFVNWAHSNNILINAYTVNSRLKLNEMNKLGVNGIITDNHEFYLKQIN